MKQVTETPFEISFQFDNLKTTIKLKNGYDIFVIAEMFSHALCDQNIRHDFIEEDLSENTIVTEERIKWKW